MPRRSRAHCEGSPRTFAQALRRVKASPASYASLSERWRENREVALCACRLRGLNLAHVSPALAADRAVVLAAVRENGTMLACAPTFAADATVVMAAVRKSGVALEYAAPGLRRHMPIAAAAVGTTAAAYTLVAPRLQADHTLVRRALTHPTAPLSCSAVPAEACREREVLLTMLEHGGEWVEMADDVFPTWMDDAGVVHAVLRHDPLLLARASRVLKRDPSLVLHAAAHVPRRRAYELFGSVPAVLRDMREVVEAFVAKSGWCLDLAPLRHRMDVRLACLAVAANPGYLAYSPHQGTKEVVLTAVTHKGSALVGASRALRGDIDVVCTALAHGGSAMFSYVDPSVFDTRRDAMRLLGAHPSLLGYAPEETRNDRALVLHAVARNGICLGFASEARRAERMVVLAAVRACGEALAVVGDALCGDHAIARCAVVSSPLALRFVSPRLQDDASIVRTAVAIDGRAIQYASFRLQDDRATLLCAAPTFPGALGYASECRDDKQVVLACAYREPVLLDALASPRLRYDRCFRSIVLWMHEHGAAHALERVAAEEAAHHASLVESLAAMAAVGAPEDVPAVEAMAAALAVPGGVLHRRDVCTYAREPFAPPTP